MSVLIGNGDGTFDAPVSIGLGTEPRSVAVGDFNADGRMDLAVTANFLVFDGYGYYGPYYHYEGNASVLVGNGDGTFAGPSNTGLGFGYHQSAVVADLDGNGSDDFATLNSDFGTVAVLLNDGAGNLQAPGAYSAGFYPLDVAAGDVDGDGDNDLVTANHSGANVSVMPHSPRWHDGRLWVLESGTGRLVLIDPAGGRREQVAEVLGFARGLAVCDRYAFVGLSKIRKTSAMNGVPLAERRDELRCGVAVIDIDVGRPVAALEFQTAVEEVFDVQLVPGVRFPEVVGFQKDTVHNTFVVPTAGRALP